ncbi:MAG: SEC-C metal-binding domain-containing protein [Pseudomonadota bacterium]|jgi:hypothetical protein|nr:SEC-C metal-binding domain-containing protein [Pseudomonadota bacterium]
MTAIGRNQPCPCGSGTKYKKCCALKKDKTPLGLRVVVTVVAICLLGGAVIFLGQMGEYDPSAASTAGRVWSPEHGHYH